MLVLSAIVLDEPLAMKKSDRENHWCLILEIIVMGYVLIFARESHHAEISEDLRSGSSDLGNFDKNLMNLG